MHLHYTVTYTAETWDVYPWTTVRGQEVISSKFVRQDIKGKADLIAFLQTLKQKPTYEITLSMTVTVSDAARPSRSFKFDEDMKFVYANKVISAGAVKPELKKSLPGNLIQKMNMPHKFGDDIPVYVGEVNSESNKIECRYLFAPGSPVVVDGNLDKICANFGKRGKTPWKITRFLEQNPADMLQYVRES